MYTLQFSTMDYLQNWTFLFKEYKLCINETSLHSRVFQVTPCFGVIDRIQKFETGSIGLGQILLRSE